MMLKSISLIAGVVVSVILLMIVTSLIFTIPLYFLWNWIAPLVFGLPKLTLIQTWGLGILFGLLFKTNTNVKSKG